MPAPRGRQRSRRPSACDVGPGGRRGPAGGVTSLRRHPPMLAYLLLLPGVLYLAVFYALPTAQMFLVSLWTGSISKGYEQTFNLAIYPDAFSRYAEEFIRSMLYGGLATLLAFALGFPLAYFIAFRGGRYKSL